MSDKNIITNNWFNTRELNAYQYQIDIIDNKIDDSFNRNGYAVIAASPNSGKTLMSICYIEKFLSENPKARVLVLTHATTVLRTQYYEELKKAQPSFTFCAIESGMDINDFDCQVCVALPQSLKNKKTLYNFDLIVIDEAHQYYFATDGMVKKIIEKTKPKFKLFLTGTPSKFIRKKFEIIPVSLMTLFDNNQTSDLVIEIATMNATIEASDYNWEDELKKEFLYTEEQTRSGLDDAMLQIEKRLKSWIKTSPEYYSYLNKAFGIKLPFGDIGKTLIACRSSEHAKYVNKYFNERGIKCALSIATEDLDSSQFIAFKNDPNIKVLIVIYRGILGFNMPELENVIDMTGSQNLDRIFQLMCRVTRKHPLGKKKLFIKVAGKNQIDIMNINMNKVMCLCHDEWFTSFDGKNSGSLNIPVYTKNRTGDGTKTNTNTNTAKKKDISIINFLGFPAIEFFKELQHKRDDSFSGVSYTRVMDVMNKLFDYRKNIHGYWTLETCKEDALKYKRRGDWKKESPSAYFSAHRNGWIDECCKHIPITRSRDIKYWTLETCKEDALKYNRKINWLKESNSAYHKAQKKGWIDECCKHMYKITLEICKEDALKYKRRTQWQKGSTSIYQTARKNGWLDECCKHMYMITLEICKEDALKYNRRVDWQKGSKSFYNISLKRGWLDECCKHMLTRNSWTFEKCEALAKECKDKKEFRQKYNKAYSASLRLNCIKTLFPAKVKVKANEI
jgi:superfamily II DNA or RNA helicase